VEANETQARRIRSDRASSSSPTSPSHLRANGLVSVPKTNGISSPWQAPRPPSATEVGQANSYT
jgi:hypothetical protein